MGLLFNGTTQSLSIATGAVTATPLTMACWINPPVVSDFTVYFNIGSSIAAQDDAFQMSSSSTTAVIEVTNSNASSDQVATSTLTTNINTTYHICAVFASATSRTIYVNGGNSGTNVISCIPTAGNLNATVIGGQMQGTIISWINSNIYFPAVWNVALSVLDIASLALGISPRKIQPSHLVRYPRLTGHNSPEPDMMNATGWTVAAAPPESANIRTYFP